jgi:23S rRNA pseudouridine1911/1915/1917 synthase
MTTPSLQNLHVGPEQANLTLAAALRHWQPGRSWSDIRKLIRGRRVTVNGNLTLDEARRLKVDEVVKVLDHPQAPPPTEADVRVRYIDTHLVIVEKPAGMTTMRHPEERQWNRRRRQRQPTLDELLPRVVSQLSARRNRSRGVPRRLRAVHRLDRETSGLMVFARTPEAEHALGLKFRAHDIHRVYLGVALGNVPAQTIESHLVEDRGDTRRGSTPHPHQGKRAVTHIRPIEKLNGYTVVECRLETGRTHQIRIHLAEQGHPLCGDRVYRGPFPGKPLPDNSRAPRVALHAAELGFTHPITDEPLQFSMPLPEDMVSLINRLGGAMQHRAQAPLRRPPPHGSTGETPRRRPGPPPRRASTAAGPAEGPATRPPRKRPPRPGRKPPRKRRTG